jgi:DNA invertase Pin-like site-specific DNA recombinase
MPTKPDNPRAGSGGIGGRPRRGDVTPDRVRALRQQGFSIRRIARQLGAGYGTVRKVLQDAEGQPKVSGNPSAGVL